MQSEFQNTFIGANAPSAVPARPRALSIRSRLLLLVAAVLTPALVAALVVIGWAHRGERQALSRGIQDTAQALSMVVDRELSQRALAARLLALSLPTDRVPELTDADVARFEQQARGVIEGLDGWVMLTSERGVLVDTRWRGKRTGEPLAAPALQSRSLITGLLSASDYDIASNATLPATGSPTATHYASVTEPVMRNGRAVMNVVIALRPSVMQRVLDQQGTPPGWVSTLMDESGRIVARRPGGSDYVGRLATPDMLKQLAQHPSGFHRSVTLDGVPVLLYFNTSANGWTQIVGSPSPRLVDGASSTVLPVGTAALALLLLGLVGALWVSRTITRPIDLLKQKADRLIHGEAVMPRLTGIIECDRVAVAMADAARAQQLARDTLQQEVDAAVERTRDAEKRASQSQRVAALGRLTGGVAHDFNNLLGVVGNSAYLIQRLAPEPAVQTPTAAILRAVEAGSRLTQHLLRFAGRQPVSPKPLDLRSYLTDAQDLLGTVLGMRSKVVVAVAPETQPVTVDVNELELALINLALNARDAMPRGGELRVAARNAEPREFPEMAHDRYVVLTVSDTGEGVAPDVLDRVFEPFFTTKSVGKGSGLGLAQVHGFCTQAGGFARITSTPGAGTTLWLILPMGQGVTASDARTPQPADTGLAGRHVLLVEDNDALGDATMAVLRSFGCEVQRAVTADHALKMIGEGDVAFDLVLSDVVMPGSMDGLQLARQLRQRFPRLPIVLVSGYASTLQGDVEFPVLHKPCRAQDMAEALRKALASHG